MRSPAPYFGGKRLAAPEVWARFGTGDNSPRHYIEPFAGMLGCLLNRPGWHSGVKWLETVNELNPLVANVWRAIRYDPEGVQWAAAWPVSELDLHARHADLQRRAEKLGADLVDDPKFFDAEAAGWWIWGANLAIGKGWHAETGNPAPWIHPSSSGGNNLRARACRAGLSSRLDNVRVLCGDWSRAVKPSMFNHDGVSAVFLDPPYAPTKRTKSSKIYSAEGSGSVAEDVREWCAANGSDERLRIALCGYGDEHIELEGLGWDRHEWTHRGGYSNQGKQKEKPPERIWFSPHCLKHEQLRLF